MVLKTDYKDAMYDGARKWRITQNADGTSGIADETGYTQDGDKFGANDINATNKEINRINHTTEVTLTASGWSQRFCLWHATGGFGYHRASVYDRSWYAVRPDGGTRH